MDYRPSSLTLLLATTVLASGCPGDDGVPQPDPSSSSGSEDSTGSTTAPTTSGTDPTTSADESTSTGSTPVDPDTTTGPELCGNLELDPGEICDGRELAGESCPSLGYDTGVLSCTSDCAGYDTGRCSYFNCGNALIEGREVCDGPDLGGVTCESEGFDSGTPGCANDCSALDLSECGTCGNVIVDGDEVCDAVALLGQTCVSQGFDNGQLGCATDCLTYDTTPCGTCGNALIDGAEVCDGDELDAQTCPSQGFDSGTLACGSSCLTFDTEGCGNCGNAVADGDELCDALDLNGQSCVTQGLDSGTLGCQADCNGFVTTGCGTCGNGIIDGSESCDGALLGGQTCAGLGLGGGTLACSGSCQYDFAGCDIAGFPFGGDGFYNGFSLTPGVLPCDDISATGTPTFLPDDGETQVPLGFTFTFYGTPFTEAVIASNGTVNFGLVDYLGFSNVCMPGDTFTFVQEHIVAAFWDDLDPSSAGQVYHQTLGVAGSQRFVVQWDVPFYSGSNADLIRVQAVFHQTGAIEVCYPDTLSGADFRNNGAEATAGIQRDPLTGFQFGCNAGTLTNGLMLMYLPV